MKPTTKQPPSCTNPLEKTCDWCGKQKRDVRPFGDETSACFLCRQEARRRRVFNEKLNRYMQLENS